MPKEFENILKNPSSYSDFTQPQTSKDPNLYYNDVTMDFFKRRNDHFLFYKLKCLLVLAPFMIPFQTLQVSLQLSVVPHLKKYHDAFAAKERALMKAPTEITIQDRRKFEILVKSGVTEGNIPFRAPVYSTYYEAFKGISKQGLFGFYKGGGIGLIYSFGNLYGKMKLITPIPYEQNNGREIFSILQIYSYDSKEFAFMTLIDIATYPVMLIQSRFILQNRLPEFSTYKGIKTFVSKHKLRLRKESTKGIFSQVPINIILSFCNYLNLFASNPEKNNFFILNLASFISYPFTTVMRRLQCQGEIAGMIPPRYKGMWHGMNLMLIEEGLKGLWRGYPLAALILNVQLYFFNNFLRKEKKKFYMEKIG